MFKLFGRRAETAIAEAQAPKKPVTSQDRLVQEIHDTFMTEVDKLLAYAKVTLSPETQLKATIEKANKLKALGFTKASEIDVAAQEEKRIDQIVKENNAKKQLIEAVNYFSEKYPMYKFITRESILKICKKYGLVFGHCAHYKGIIPDANVEQMLNFKIAPEDMSYMRSWYRNEDVRRFNSSDDSTNFNPMGDYIHDDYSTMNGKYLPCVPRKFGIAAPLNHFDTSGMEVDEKTRTLVKKDPVVFQRVMFKGTEYYLIVTAWGKEASDTDVMNPKMN